MPPTPQVPVSKAGPLPCHYRRPQNLEAVEAGLQVIEAILLKQIVVSLDYAVTSFAPLQWAGPKQWG